MSLPIIVWGHLLVSVYPYQAAHAPDLINLHKDALGNGFVVKAGASPHTCVFSLLSPLPPVLAFETAWILRPEAAESNAEAEAMLRVELACVLNS